MSGEDLRIPEIQVIMPGSVQYLFREWLTSSGYSLYKIPVEDDLPTYGIKANR